MKDKITYLKDIYNQQHYFIDRHDSMAEKFINILLVEVTALAIMLSMVTEIATFAIVKYAAITIYIVLFSITLIKLFLVIRPLSKMARNKNNEALLRAENKNWIDASLIYYQGINALRKKAIEQEHIPTETFLNSLSDEKISKDLVQQIFILAQYSDYKHRQIQKAVKWIIGTTITGIFAAILLLIL
ncbi:MAG: hypothetical protein HDQ98_07510 [Lachnospiraceae bacterium]|nr:hypothetical protein [Lachnospiraceae bacterium]